MFIGGQFSADSKRKYDDFTGAKWDSKGKGSGKKGDGKGKSSKSKKDSRKSKDKVGQVPAELKNLNLATDGVRRCFAFNIKGCTGGQNCPKGQHTCMIKGCGGQHGALSCPNAAR